MMKRFSPALLVAALSALAVTGCGMRPMYGTQTVDGSGPISISQIDGRMGHQVRQELSRSLASGLPGLEPGANLFVTIEEDLKRLALQQDESVSRTSLIANADYILSNAEGEIVGKGSVVAQADFAAAISSFSDISLQNDARDRAAMSLARRLRDRLVLDLQQQAANKGEDS